MIDYKGSTWAIQIKNTKERLGGINFQINNVGGGLSINARHQMGQIKLRCLLTLLQDI